jgi:hypothetical protein
MSDAVRVFPDAPDVFACAELACPDLDSGTLEGCKKRACPFTYQWVREEAAIDQARKDEQKMKNDA